MIALSLGCCQLESSTCCCCQCTTYSLSSYWSTSQSAATGKNSLTGTPKAFGVKTGKNLPSNAKMPSSKNCCPWFAPNGDKCCTFSEQIFELKIITLKKLGNNTSFLSSKPKLFLAKRAKLKILTLLNRVSFVADCNMKGHHCTQSLQTSAERYAVYTFTKVTSAQLGHADVLSMLDSCKWPFTLIKTCSTKMWSFAGFLIAYSDSTRKTGS